MPVRNHARARSKERDLLVVPVKLSLARCVPGPMHGIKGRMLGAAALPQPELSILQHVLRPVAIQTQGLLFSPRLAHSYPAVYMSRLPASLQYADVLNIILAEAPRSHCEHSHVCRWLQLQPADLADTRLQPGDRGTSDRSPWTALSARPGTGLTAHSRSR